jgi:dihydrofolate reductase
VTGVLPPRLQIIAALDRHRAIGKDGGLPWHLPEDLAHFKRTTSGHVILMGRRTFVSIGRPLPKRRNLVISSVELDGVETFRTLEAAVTAALETDPSPFVIGGARIYEAALPLTRTLHLTWVDEEVTGADTFFPDFDASQFHEVERRQGADPRLTFVRLERTSIS